MAFSPTRFNFENALIFDTMVHLNMTFPKMKNKNLGSSFKQKRSYYTCHLMAVSLIYFGGLPLSTYLIVSEKEVIEKQLNIERFHIVYTHSGILHLV